jgi:hypothetical protein
VVRIKVKLPSAMSKELAEETGIHIGDGSMNFYKNSGLYSLRGHKTDDEKYYRYHIKSLFKKLYDADIKLRTWPDVFGFQLCSNELVKFKHEFLGLPLGPKGEITIPKVIMKNDEFAKACLRGIFDTDGNIYFEKKKNGPYPRIHLCTTSRKLGAQLEELIRRFGFTSISVWEIKPNERWMPTIRICVRGNENFRKWFKTIGTSNPKNMAKFNSYL